MTSEAVTLVTGNPQNVDNSALRREISFNAQGNVYQLTTYIAASSGSVVHRIQPRAWGKRPDIGTEFGEKTSSGAVNNSRLTSITYIPPMPVDGWNRPTTDFFDSVDAWKNQTDLLPIRFQLWPLLPFGP